MPAQGLGHAGQYLHRSDDRQGLVAALGHGVLPQHPDQGPDAGDRVQADGLHPFECFPENPGVAGVARSLLAFPGLFQALPHHGPEFARQPQTLAAANLGDVLGQYGEPHLPVLEKRHEHSECCSQNTPEQHQVDARNNQLRQAVKIPYNAHAAQNAVACRRGKGSKNRASPVLKGEGSRRQYEEHEIGINVIAQQRRHQKD